MPTPKPFTVPHIRAWARGLILDNGNPWVLEPFQERFLRDVFAGYLEAWLVIPEGNAKTTLLGGFVLYHAQFRKFASVTVAAAARDQARWLYQAAEGFVQRSPAIRPLFKPQEGYLRIRCDPSDSRIQIYSSDDRVGDGAIPTLGLLEELHRHRDLSLYRTWRGKVEKRGGQLIAISTAGAPESEFEAVRKRMRDEATHSTRRGAFLRAASETTILHEYAVPDDADPDHIPTVKKANPLKTITLAQLKRKHDSPSMVPSHWRRFACGMPARMDEWVEPAAWDRLKVDIGGVVPGDQVFIGLRVGAGVGIGIAAEREDEKIAVACQVIPAPASGRVPFREMEAALVDLCETYDVLEIEFDPDQLGNASDVLEEQGLPMEAVPQRPTRLTKATATLWRLISGGLLMHDGDPELRRQVLAGHTKEGVGGWRLDPTPDTAALIALAMACHEASKGTPDPLIVVSGVG